LDNIESVLLTVGSPTLAAYSLALTVLNGRWIARRFSKYTYPNVRNAVRALSSLQQAPVQVSVRDGLLASLIVLPQNDEWWKELIEWLEYPHTWSVSAVTSIAWVVIAYAFTVVDSFTGDLSPDWVRNTCGQSVASIWLWLLPVVVGWLLVSPKCNEERLRNAMLRANLLAYIATDSQVLLARRLSKDHHAIDLALVELEDDNLRVDERNTAPVYNFARFLPWVQSVETILLCLEAASARCERHESVDNDNEWVLTQPNEKPDMRNRMGNLRQVARYCTMEGLQLHPSRKSRGRWGPNVRSRIITASLFALFLQWGTTWAAIIIVYFTPTTGISP
jgi:hypothetical protein